MKITMIKNIFLVILTFISVYLFVLQNNYKTDLEASTQVISAMNDTIRHYSLERGRAATERRAIAVENERLKMVSETLYTRIETLKKELNKPLARANEVKEVKAYSSTEFIYKDSLKINFESIFYRDRRNNIRFATISNNPDFKVSNTDAILFKPRRRFADRFNFSIQTGVGVLYNPFTQSINPGIYGGFGVSYNF